MKVGELRCQGNVQGQELRTLGIGMFPMPFVPTGRRALRVAKGACLARVARALGKCLRQRKEHVDVHSDHRFFGHTWSYSQVLNRKQVIFGRFKGLGGLVPWECYCINIYTSMHTWELRITECIWCSTGWWLVEILNPFREDLMQLNLIYFLVKLMDYKANDSQK